MDQIITQQEADSARLPQTPGARSRRIGAQGVSEQARHWTVDLGGVTVKRFIAPGRGGGEQIKLHPLLLGSCELGVITAYKVKSQARSEGSHTVASFACPNYYFGDCGNDFFFHQDVSYFNPDLENASDHTGVSTVKLEC